MNAIVNFRLCKLSDKELLDKVDAMTDKMYTDQKVPVRHIPARPDEDYDLLVGELVKRYHGKTESPSPCIDEQAVVSKVQEVLLRLMHPMTHTNGYPSMAVPHATILELPALMKTSLSTSVQEYTPQDLINLDQWVEVYENLRVKMNLSDAIKELVKKVVQYSNQPKI